MKLSNKSVIKLAVVAGLLAAAASLMIPPAMAAEAGKSAASKAKVERIALATAEARLEQAIGQASAGNSMQLAGAARAVYVEGVGVLLTAEVNLATAQISLMEPTLNDKQKADLRQQKVATLPKLKAALKAALLNSLQDLGTVPANEKIVIAVILPRYKFEDPAGLPMQLTFQATKAELASGGAAIQSSEF